jgi:hypothetical protein
VVDAETGTPLEGVVVLAQWDKLSPGIIHQSRDFHDVDEVVTDVNGRFVIPSRWLLTTNPLVTIDGPILHMFKPGYGEWVDRGLPSHANIDEMRRLMERQDVIFAMTQVRTAEERSSTWPFVPRAIPRSKIPRFVDALNQERRSYGLNPIGPFR